MKLILRDKKVNKVREEGYVPGVIYSNDFPSVNVQVPNLEFTKAFQSFGYTKSFDVKLDGKKHVAYIKDIQVDIMDQHKIIHFDLMKVSKGDTLNANVALHFINKDQLPQRLVFVSIMDELPIEYNVGSGVAYIDVDVSGVTEDTPLYVKDIVLPEGIKVDTDLDQIVCSLTTGSTEEVQETEEETADHVVVPSEEE